MCKLAMDYNICVSPDGGGEVGVERDVEGIVMGRHIFLRSTTKIQCKLHREDKSSIQIVSIIIWQSQVEN